MRDYLIWLRGEIVRQSTAKVSVLSPMAQFGLNVFEGMRSYWNADEQQLYTFRLDDHLHRLIQSCRLIGFEPPAQPDAMAGFLNETLRANAFREDSAVRMTIFGDGEGTWSDSSPVSMFIAPIVKARTDMMTWTARKACVSSWQRISDNVLPPRAKVGANYINGRYAHIQAVHDGYDLPILLNREGRVAEGAGACLFLVRKGRLVTPGLTSSVLESITRETVITLAHEAGLQTEERAVDRSELYLADELFLCGTSAEITPIGKVDRFVIGDGKPGAITSQLLSAYHGVASGADRRFADWRTPVY